MLIPSETKQAIARFGRAVVSGSRSSLQRQGMNRTNTLSDSIDFDMEVNAGSFGAYFEMEDYGVFQDQGVNGKKKNHGSPFSYRDKMPSMKDMTVRKGLMDKNGKPIGRKSLQYLISRKIFEDGIKPSLFFTKPFEAAFEKLPDSVVEAFALDTEKFLKSTLKDNSK